jgi:hypothetical protein
MSMTHPPTSPTWAGLALLLLAGGLGCSSDSDQSSDPGIEPEYYGDVAVLRLERNEAMGLCFVPNTAEDVTIDRTAGNGSIAGSVFLEGVEGQDECLAQNYPDEVCVVRTDLASSALTATEAADLEALIAAMPQGNCEPDPNTNGDPCITTGVTFDGTREDNCMGGTQLVEGHGMALKALVAFIDSLAVTKLTR